MNHELEVFLTRLRENKGQLPTGEEATCQGVVLPILGKLGWDRDNVFEVIPQFQIGSDRVDYCLKVNNKACVFIEVKRYGEQLDAHQEQLLKYAFKQSVGLAILTNGSAWWFYLPSLEVPWEQRKFYAIDVLEQEVEHIIKSFSQFLSRVAIQDGSALIQAKEVHKSREKIRIIERTIPDAWSKLCEEPDEFLVDLMVDKVESLCGHKPEPGVISKFLRGTLSPNSIQSQKAAVPPTPAPKIYQQPMQSPKNRSGEPIVDGNYTFSRPASFSFRSSSYSIRKWKNMLLLLCQILHENHRDFEQQSKNLDGRDRKFISRNPSGMQEAREIPESNLYVETCYSANDIVRKCKELVKVMGYHESDLQIEAVRKK